MADFYGALGKTLKYEGIYSNDALDAGGETYCGISRVHNPLWPGWPILDKHKSFFAGDTSFTDSRLHADMKPHVEAFYEQIWDVFGLDGVADQELAEEIFDVAVNMGIGRATKFVQEGLNVLNRDQKLWPDLKVDGDFGPVTKKLFLEAKGEHEILAKVIVILRGSFYLTIVKGNTGQEKFIRGWLSRVKAG